MKLLFVCFSTCSGVVKKFLDYHWRSLGDRYGLRDQMVGPWQVPVADCAVTTVTYDSYAGEAMAMGERTPLALIDAPAVWANGWRDNY